MRSVRSAHLPDALCRAASALLWAMVASQPGNAAAQEQPVREVDRCGSDVEPGGTNLATALEAGGRITFRCGGPATIRITRLHSISRAVEIDGGGQVTLDGDNQTAFLASDADLVVRFVNLTIRRMGNANIPTSGVVRAERVAVVNS